MARPVTLTDNKSQEYDANNPLPTDDYWIGQAIRQINENDGAAVSVSQKRASLLKFGENESVGTSEAEIQALAGSEVAEVMVDGNDITHLSSSSTSDTAMSVEIQGHTATFGDGSNDQVYTSVTQTVAVTGQTKKALSTPLARIQRVKVGKRDSSLNGLVGTLYVYENVTATAGVPDDDTAVHCIVKPAENQSLKAKSSTASDEYLLVSKIYASINKKTAGYAVIRFKIREPNTPWRTKFKRTASTTGGALEMDIRPYFIVPPNTDIMITAEADAVSTPVAAGYNGVYAKVTTFPQAGTGGDGTGGSGGDGGTGDGGG